MNGSLFRHCYGKLPEATVLASPDGRILQANRAARELLRFECDLTGSALPHLVVDPPAKVARRLELWGRSHDLLPGALTFKGSGESGLPCRIDGAAVRPPEQGSFLLLRVFSKTEAARRFRALNDRIDALHREVLQRRRAEEDLRASERELRTANQALVRANEDLSQFAFAASHDLQEPLRMVTSYSQLLIKAWRKGNDAEAAAAVGVIQESTERMRELLADLLAYTQVSADIGQALERIDLNGVLRKATYKLRMAMEQSEAMVTNGALPEAGGQEAHLIQLFQNLIENAIKYRGDNPPRIHVSAEKLNGDWRLAVADNGMGIDAEYHQQIFGVFKRLHGRKIPGTGIGLALCQRVVERYGGRIWVDSRLGQGATFYFTLPAAKGELA